MCIFFSSLYEPHRLRLGQINLLNHPMVDTTVANHDDDEDNHSMCLYLTPSTSHVSMDRPRVVHEFANEDNKIVPSCF